jgi:hypothetical protein
MPVYGVNWLILRFGNLEVAEVGTVDTARWGCLLTTKVALITLAVF